MDEAKTLENLTKYKLNFTLPEVFFTGTSQLSIKKFFETYEAKYNKPPTNLALRGFIAMDTPITLYKKANSNRSEAIVRYRSSYQSLPSLLEKFSITSTIVSSTIYNY